MSVKVPRSITKAQKTHQNCILLETCWIIYWRIQLITMTSEEAWGRLKTLSSLLFTQPIVQAQIKESIKAPRHRPLWRYPVNSLHKGPVTRKMFAFDDVIMPVNNPKWFCEPNYRSSWDNENIPPQQRYIIITHTLRHHNWNLIFNS